MKKLIVANWKMTPTGVKEAEKNFRDISKFSKKLKGIDVVVCPPFVYLDRFLKFKIKNLKLKLGAQDVFWENPKEGGSYTGEVSLAMLKNFGVKYLIIGHSEKRNYLYVSNEMVNKKLKTVLKSGLKAVFCVGEPKRDREGRYLKFVKEEILKGLEKIVHKDLKNLIIAYEPIWAISSSKNAKADTPKNLFEMTIFIKKVLFQKYGRRAAESVPILYGGSVNAQNVDDFIKHGNAQGVLVGRASFKSNTFIDLLKSIS